MKKSLRFDFAHKLFALVGLCLANGVALAVDPVEGLYAGVMVGLSYTPHMNFDITTPLSPVPVPGGLSLQPLANVAGQFGYRIKHFRIEGELLVNYNPYTTLSVDGISIHQSGDFNTGLGMQGQAVTTAFMANGLYEFYTPGEQTHFAPYLGLGIGYAYIVNKVRLYENNIAIAGFSNLSQTTTAPAAQLIIGGSYFTDDFTSVGIDFRYLTTQTVSPFESRFQIASINLSVNGAFDCG